MMEAKLPGCGIKATPHITSRLKTLKRLWQTAYDIIYGPNTSGFGWDPETKLVTADDDVWDEYHTMTQLDKTIGAVRTSANHHRPLLLLHRHTYATAMNDRCFPMQGQPFSHFVFTNPIVDLSNFGAPTSNPGIGHLLHPIFLCSSYSNPKQVPKRQTPHSNLVTQVTLHDSTFVALSHGRIHNLVEDNGKVKRTDNRLKELGITMEDVEAFESIGQHSDGWPRWEVQGYDQRLQMRMTSMRSDKVEKRG
ncbi:hypothetical protein K1719_046548 [Acacia pycnantha]|nr:hypothetical protein K1719_046548 [Acacia pycnantha]